jgi:hypothetical protein
MKSQLMYPTNNDSYHNDPPPLSMRIPNWFASLKSGESRISRQMVIALILGISLIAFEIFNFDTTRFALNDFLGGVSFLGVTWAAILAVAFCAIDFAGLVRMFTPEDGTDEPKAVWYLMGAWLLGATMNAVMTWWAVSLTLLDHDFGNEVLSRAQLLRFVPIFVAVLVWLTRILFIGAVTVTGEKLINSHRRAKKSTARRQTRVRRAPAPVRKSAPPVQENRGPAQLKERSPGTPSRRPAPPPPSQSVPSKQRAYEEPPTLVIEQKPVAAPPPPTKRRATSPANAARVKRRPPTPRTTKPPVAGSKNVQARPNR